MKRVLITGGSGYIGQYLLRHCPETVKAAVTIRNEQKWLSVENNYFFPSHPLLLEKEIAPQIADKPFDIIIHTAAAASLAFCEKDPLLANRLNGEAVAELAKYCSQRGIRLFYLSTDIVFKGDAAPYAEDDQPEPVNVYGRSKLAGEIAVREFAQDYAVGRIALTLGRGLGQAGNFIDWFLRRLDKGLEIPLFVDEIRTPAAVSFLAKEIWRLALSEEQGVFHLAGEESLSRFELGRKICAYLGRGEHLLKAISVADMKDYERPLDVSLASRRGLQNEKILIPGISRLLNTLLDGPR